MQIIRGEYELTDDKSRFDLAAIHELLLNTYWAADRPFEVMARSIEYSLCLGLLQGSRQIGFCRAVTDRATFSWICDVVVHVEHRGRGLGKWMVNELIHHPQVQTRSQLLATRDAHGLYQRHGFHLADQDYLKRILDYSRVSAPIET